MFLLILYAITILVIFVRGNSKIKSIVGIKHCDPATYVITAAYVIICVVALIVYIYIIENHK